MLQVRVESEAGPFGDMPKRFHSDGRQVEITENIDQWHGAGYRYFKVKGDDATSIYCVWMRGAPSGN
jgi:hypothetical protein